MLSTLREWRTDQQETEERQDDSVFRSIVERLDAGEELDQETIEKHVSEFPDHRPVCPKQKDHKAEQVGTSKRPGGQTKVRCRCNSCGEEWLQDPPDPRRDPNKWTIEELEAGVELLRKRRAWANEAAKLPQLREKKQGLRERLDQATEAVKEANKARDDLLEERYGLENEIRRAETAQRQLESTGSHSFEERQLLQRRAKVAQRMREIHKELWGNSTAGKFEFPFHGTIGSEYVSHDAEINKLQHSNKSKDRQRLKELKERKAEIKRTKVEPLENEWNDLQREYDSLNARHEELQKTKLVP